MVNVRLADYSLKWIAVPWGISVKVPTSRLLARVHGSPSWPRSASWICQARTLPSHRVRKQLALAIRTSGICLYTRIAPETGAGVSRLLGWQYVREFSRICYGLVPCKIPVSL